MTASTLQVQDPVWQVQSVPLVQASMLKAAKVCLCCTGTAFGCAELPPVLIDSADMICLRLAIRLNMAPVHSDSKEYRQMCANCSSQASWRAHTTFPVNPWPLQDMMRMAHAARELTEASIGAGKAAGAHQRMLQWALGCRCCCPSVSSAMVSQPTMLQKYCE